LKINPSIKIGETTWDILKSTQKATKLDYKELMGLTDQDP